MTGWVVAAVLAGLALWLSRALGKATSDLREAQRRYEAMRVQAEAVGDVATMDDRAVVARFMRSVRENGLPASTESDDDPDRGTGG